MRTFAFAIAATLLLASCTDDPKPIEPKPSASSKSTAAPPPIPEQATKNTPAGAASFVKFWIENSNYAARTGNTSMLKDLSDAKCSGCRRYIDLYESTYSQGGYFKGGDRTIGDVDLEVGKNEVYVQGKLRAAPGAYRTNDSAPERKSEAEVTDVVFAVSFANKRWRMTQIGLAPKD